MTEYLILLLFLLYALYGCFSLIVNLITKKGILQQLKEVLKKQKA